MLRFIVLTLAAITSAQNRPQRSFHHFDYSVASESQIKNAIENNYDDTGPGAKSPEQAFKTFNNLEDALINYLDDPDTKLPDHERAKAIHRLVKPDHYSTGPNRYLPKITSEYSKWKPISDTEPISILNKFGFNRDIYNQFVPYKNNIDYSLVDNQAQIQNVQSYSKPVEQYKLQSIQSVRSSPVSLAHYSKVPEGDEEYNPNPQYSFSYGVHDKRTGDSKSAHESRDGGLVRGFYTFMDADGKQRTVHYTADDQQGFRATVQRTHGNAQ